MFLKRSLRKPLPFSNKDIDSKRLVFPVPFGPIITLHLLLKLIVNSSKFRKFFNLIFSKKFKTILTRALALIHKLNHCSMILLLLMVKWSHKTQELIFPRLIDLSFQKYTLS